MKKPTKKAAKAKTRKVRVWFTATIGANTTVVKVRAIYERVIARHGPGFPRTKVKAEDVGER